jgi:TRAP-type C4-dicarboxylate transport system permease large subunit
LVAGAIISTILTLLVVPVIYYISERKKWETSPELTKKEEIEIKNGSIKPEERLEIKE